MTPVFANVLQPLIDATKWILEFFHDSVGLSWGLSIVALTVVVRALLMPLTIKQYHSMQNLQRLSPQIKALQEKYKGDRQRLNQEMMRFYQENKVNPLGSCLPLLAQLPFFLALFYMLQDDLRLEICQQSADPCGEIPAASFLFIPDITDNATGGVLIALIVLYVGSQLLSSLLMSTTVDPNQRRLMMALPLIFVAFIINFPAGLIVYWITTNIWTIGQQWAVKRLVASRLPPLPPEVAKKGAVATAAPAPNQGKKSSGETSPNGDTVAAPVRTTAPPRPPRKKKKRSGRRR